MELDNSVVETDWIHVISETSREKPYYCRRSTSDISWDSPVDFEVLKTSAFVFDALKTCCDMVEGTVDLLCMSWCAKIKSKVSR